MRTTHVCPKCRHNRVLSIRKVPDSVGPSLKAQKIAVTSSGSWGWNPGTSAGDLSAVVCRSCGFTELYVSNPKSILVDGDLVTELVGSETEGPYR